MRPIAYTFYEIIQKKFHIPVNGWWEYDDRVVLRLVDEFRKQTGNILCDESDHPLMKEMVDRHVSDDFTWRD